MASMELIARRATGVIVAARHPHAHAGGACTSSSYHEILPDACLSRPGGGDFLAEDGVRLAQDIELFAVDLRPDVRTAKARAGERLAVDHARRAGPAPCRPARTSSLNSIAHRLDDGAQSQIFSGRPPTLWWDLITLVPSTPKLSITSG